MNHHEQKIKELMGQKDYKPYVSFFDHAAEDPKASEKSGRPRFVERVYIQKIPSAPDIPVRDIFTRAKTPEDELKYPEEWAVYCERKEAISNLRPPIAAIPGMDVASRAELEALGIRDCEAFVNYPKSLDELEPLRLTAKRIMEVSDEIRKGRAVVRNAANGQVHHPTSVYRASPKEEKSNTQESDKEESFTYQFQVSA